MLADLGLLYCAMFWGFTFPTMKILVGIYPACWLLFLRFSVSSVIIYVFFRKRIKILVDKPYDTVYSVPSPPVKEILP